MTGPQPSRPEDTRPPSKPGCSARLTPEEWVEQQLAKFPAKPPAEAVPLLRRVWLPALMEDDSAA